MSAKADLSEFTLRLASPDQEEAYWRATFVPWARGKEWEAFRASQIKSKTGESHQDGACKSWVLVRRDDLDGEVYSGCQTYRRKSHLLAPGSAEVQEVISYGIASVCTPEKHHRNGFATRMLSLLHYYISLPSTLPPFPTAQWGEAPAPLPADVQASLPPAVASILFSDVGSTFYSRSTIGVDRPGWIVADEDSQQISWKMAPPKGTSSSRGWIYRQDLGAVAKELSAAARKRTAADHKSSDVPVWSTDPASTGTMAYVPAMAMDDRPADWPYSEADEPCGLRIPATQPDQEECIVLFTGSHETPLGTGIAITYTHNLDAERLPTLLEALDECGAKMGLKEGMVWGYGPDSPLGRAWAESGRLLTAGKRPERKGHLVGISWYGDHQERGKLGDSGIWHWC